MIRDYECSFCGKDIDRGNVKFNRVGLPKLNAQKFQAWFDNRQLFFLH